MSLKIDLSKPITEAEAMYLLERGHELPDGTVILVPGKDAEKEGNADDPNATDNVVQRGEAGGSTEPGGNDEPSGDHVTAPVEPGDGDADDSDEADVEQEEAEEEEVASEPSNPDDADAEDGDVAEDDGDDEDNYDDERAWSFQELREEAKKRGLSGSGSRVDLIERLRANDAEDEDNGE